jgi:hypothetical protein
MTEFVFAVLAVVPFDVLPHLPSATPSAFTSRQAPGRGAYIVGAFIGLGILMLAMVLLRLPPKRANRRTLDE